MNMKKILGILLALCFLVSVTAGAVSAKSNDDFKKSDDHGKKFDKHDKCFKKIWIKGFWEKKVVKKVTWHHGEKKVVKKVIKIWHKGYWKIVKVPCKHHDNHGHR